MRAVLALADYALLPSRFVETFGLAALESLRVDTPVIGPHTGGLAALIPDELAIDLSRPADELARRILDMWRDGTGRDDASRESRRSIVAAHSRESWLELARERVLGPDVRRILMVSDYDAPIGGVERHIETISVALRDAGYEVRTFGKKPRRTPIGRFERALDMLGTFA